jgi:hypothetical protein
MQHYVFKVVSDLRQVRDFLRVLPFPPPIILTTPIKLNIVESGVKHHSTTIPSITHCSNVTTSRLVFGLSLDSVLIEGHED